MVTRQAVQYHTNRDHHRDQAAPGAKPAAELGPHEYGGAGNGGVKLLVLVDRVAEAVFRAVFDDLCANEGRRGPATVERLRLGCVEPHAQRERSGRGWEPVGSGIATWVVVLDQQGE